MRDRWFDEITLDEVARAAGVTVQTVIRRYGGKQGLLEAATDWLARDIGTRRASPPDDVPAALDALVRDYEVIGDFLLRLLAQEERHPALKQLLDFGRAGHRNWVAVTFRQMLEGLSPAARRSRLALLIVATDVYTWKLLRRDQGFSVASVKKLMTALTEEGSAPRHVSKGGNT
jgi:AcrR family transcriptional regulator